MRPRLTVFELHHLGDAVMALPFLRGARDVFDTTVFCHPPVAGLLQASIDGIGIIEAKASLLAQVAQSRAIGYGEADAAACVWADARTHVLMALTGAGRRAGFPMTPGNYYASSIPWRRRRLVLGEIITAAGERLLDRPLLTHPVHRQSASQHHLEDWEQLAGALGFRCDASLPWLQPQAALPPDAAQWIDHQDGRRLVLVHPGGRLPTKRWPYFQELLTRLAEWDDIATLIVQPPGETAPEPVGPRQTRISLNHWREIFATFNRADVVVCNDSLASHLGAALGKPVVAIFGSANPDWFAPFDNRALIAATNACRFRPCIDRCVMPSVICLETVGSGLVETRLRTALNTR